MTTSKSTLQVQFLATLRQAGVKETQSLDILRHTLTERGEGSNPRTPHSRPNREAQGREPP